MTDAKRIAKLEGQMASLRARLAARTDQLLLVLLQIDDLKRAATSAPAAPAPAPAASGEPRWVCLEGMNADELAAYDYGCAGANAAILSILDGKDTGAGVSNEPWESVRRRLLALVRRPAASIEPDMQHPKIQALLGSNARQNIELQLVEQLLDDPDCELTSMDMEYWHGLHDKLREKLIAAASTTKE